MGTPSSGPALGRRTRRVATTPSASMGGASNCRRHCRWCWRHGGHQRCEQLGGHAADCCRREVSRQAPLLLWLLLGKESGRGSYRAVSIAACDGCLGRTPASDGGVRRPTEGYCPRRVAHPPHSVKKNSIGAQLRREHRTALWGLRPSCPYCLGLLASPLWGQRAKAKKIRRCVEVVR